ncbi:hypothetical protein MRX96_048370 [Rhipicephalus microplus]
MLPSVDQPVTLIEDGSNVRRGSFTKPRPLAWLPVLLVSALISCAYYAYVLVFCRLIVAEESTAKAVTFGTGFHLLLSMCIWSYAKTTATVIPDVPPAYLLSADQEQVLANCQNERTRHGLLEMLASQKGVFTRGARWFRALLRVMPSPQAGQMPPLLHVPKVSPRTLCT